MSLLEKTLSEIKPININSFTETQKRLDNLTKPLGSLGQLEEIAKKIVAITGKQNPELKTKFVFTLAGDHGVVEEGVSAYPKEVTPQMIYNFLRGGAAINVLARHIGAKVIVVDMGVATEMRNTKCEMRNFRDKKINFGTKNFTKEPAMTREEAIRSLEIGIELIEETLNKERIDVVALGDMGIGNTTPSAAIISVVTGNPVEKVTGRGTGIDDVRLQHKIEVIKKAIEVNQPNSKDGIDVLSKIGGYEIGGLAGITLAAAKNKIPVVMDGLISAAAVLIATVIKPEVKDYIIAGHRSQEPGHSIILKYLGMKPVLDLDMRLGEGTGAVLSMSVIEAGCKILNEMATFDNAGISKKT